MASSTTTAHSAHCEPQSVSPCSPLSLERALHAFEPISLAQMESALHLLNRSEQKYVMAQHVLPCVLSELSCAYRILVVANLPTSRYRTLYYDTPDLAMYFRHHAGAASRYKVRAREYIDSHLAFLEVKHRIDGRRTRKQRIPTHDLTRVTSARAQDFLAETCPYPAGDLAASLWNHFTRITLVSKQRPERVTLDLDLSYRRDGESAALPGIVVGEVKYEGQLYQSAFAHVMHEYQVRATGFSKYCMGVSLLYPEVKQNRFKAKHLLIARLQGDSHDVC